MARHSMGGDLDSLAAMVIDAMGIVEAQLPAPAAQDIRERLEYVGAVVERLRELPSCGDATIALDSVYRFLELRGESQPHAEFEREAGLPRDVFERLDRSASHHPEFLQIQYAISPVLRQLGDAAPEASRLLTAAAALGKSLEARFAHAPDADPVTCDGARLKVDDACRALERLSRFDSAAEVERTTGVPRAIVERMRSAAASAGKRDGWGDVR